MKRVYIDMDGVLCDFFGRYDEIKLKEPSVEVPHHQYGFFVNLDPMEGALEAFWELSKQYEVYILTRPSFGNAMSYTEKRIWVERHLGVETVRRLIMSFDKALLIGDYLIDDHPWPDFQGEQIHFGSEAHPDWRAVQDYLL